MLLITESPVGIGNALAYEESTELISSYSRVITACKSFANTDAPMKLRKIGADAKIKVVSVAYDKILILSTCKLAHQFAMSALLPHPLGPVIRKYFPEPASPILILILWKRTEFLTGNTRSQKVNITPQNICRAVTTSIIDVRTPFLLEITLPVTILTHTLTWFADKYSNSGKSLAIAVLKSSNKICLISEGCLYSLCVHVPLALIAFFKLSIWSIAYSDAS